jgi:hypothetical protein
MVLNGRFAVCQLVRADPPDAHLEPRFACDQPSRAQIKQHRLLAIETQEPAYLLCEITGHLKWEGEARSREGHPLYRVRRIRRFGEDIDQVGDVSRRMFRKPYTSKVRRGTAGYN